MGASELGDAGWVESRPSHGWRALDLHELWRYRELAGFLAMRSIRARYKQAVLGMTWTLLQPLAGTVALVIVFRRLIDVPSDGIPYPLFALLGYAFWTYVSNTVTSATSSLLRDVDLVTKAYFPRMLLPLAATLPGLVTLVVALLMLAALMAVEGHGPPAAVIALPVLLVLAVLVAFGTGLWLSTLNVLYRDVGHAVSFVIQLWFFASPVAYPSSLVEGGWRWIYAANPVSGLIDASRAAVLGGPLRPGLLSISLLSMLLILAGGLACFQRLERRFADVI